MTELASEPPRIFIVEDQAGFRDARVRYFNEVAKVPAVGYASGESFLADLTLETRGVVSLDIKLGKGCLTGCEVFERMLHIGSHMPVSFLTGPFEDHLRLCVDMVTRRANVNYFGKTEPIRLVNEQLLRYFAAEPALYETAVREHWLMDLICVVMTHSEREALDGTYKGLSTVEWADQIGIAFRTVQQQIACGVRRYTGRHKLTGSNLDTILLFRELAPLMARLKCQSLQHLAARDFARRLTLLSQEQQNAVHRMLMREVDANVEAIVHGALALMRVGDSATLRDLLKNAGFNLQGWMMPELPKETHGLVGHWLEWVGAQKGEVPWEKLPPLAS